MNSKRQKCTMRIKAFRLFLTTALLAVVLGAMPAPVARAADQVVTNTNDSGAGSLRQAITDLGAGETITFNLTYPATIILTSGELTINKNLTITGPGADQLTISGNNSSRVFNVSSGTVTISGLTIRYGDVTGSGGGIYNAGTLTLENCTVSDNEASRYGGGIENDGGTLTIHNSTISGNETTVATGLNGGGIDNDQGTLTINTISGNRAYDGGGIDNNRGTLTINTSTITDNAADRYAGGIDNYESGATTEYKNTIIYGNTAGTSEPDCSNFNGTITSLGYNLFKTGTDCTTTGTDVTTSDAKLGSLADNGGPTQTHALQSGSPAINQIGNGVSGCGTTYTTDQRSYNRPEPAGGSCDIGAYEYGADPPTAVTLVRFVASPAGGVNGFTLPLALVAVGLLVLRARRRKHKP